MNEEGETAMRNHHEELIAAPVVLAGLSTLVVGSAWYSPKTFGKEWEKLIRQDEDKKGKKKSKK